MTQTIVLAGASGFIGHHLARRFEEDGAQVRTIGRGTGADARWDGDLGEPRMTSSDRGRRPLTPGRRGSHEPEHQAGTHGFRRPPG